LLAEGRFLAFSVDLARSGQIRSPAHLQVELGKEELLVRSVAGYVAVKYPPGWRVALNRDELSPWWGAWHPALLGLTALGVVLALMFTWFVLATLYAIPVWAWVLFANRDLKLRECWRFAGASLLPGGLLLAAGILCYDFGVVDLVGLAFLAAGQVVLGWIYLFIGPLFLPRSADLKAGGKNPFNASSSGTSP
jgi:hypothetical protein